MVHYFRPSPVFPMFYCESSQKLNFPLKNGGVLKFRTEQVDRCDLRASGKPWDQPTQCQEGSSRCMMISVHKILDLVCQKCNTSTLDL